MDQFHEYLYGNTFDVNTDNNLLTYVLSTAKLDAMGHRWIAGLANYNFHIHYKSRKSNMEADALARIDWKICDETIVAAAITGDIANIEVVSCSVHAIKSFLMIPCDTIAISKTITRSPNQSPTTCLEPGPSVLQTVSKVDDMTLWH